MKINNRWSKVERSKNTYLPSQIKIPLISKNTKVCLIGSCFADEMGWVLNEKKINIGDVDYVDEIKAVSYPWGTFFSPKNLFEAIEICLNEKIDEITDENSFIRVPKTLRGNHFEGINQLSKDEDYKLISLFMKARLETNDYAIAKKEIKKKNLALKNSLINADVVIITLGLIETWIDKDKKKAWHSFHGNALKKEAIEKKATFKQLSFEEVCKYVQEIIKTINLINEKKIIFTISPIPLKFTFTNKDVVIANKYSKSILRAAIENFVDQKKIFYFPSLEIVQDCVGWPNSFKSDKRHVKIEVFKDIIAPKFLEAFTDLK